MSALAEMDPLNDSSFLMRDIFRAVRTRQWAKNGLLFAGFLFAGHLRFAREAPPLFIGEFTRVLLAFACFCALSGAAYIINDWRDIERDRLHPLKKERPLAAGKISLRVAAFLIGFCLIFATLSSWLVVKIEPQCVYFPVTALAYFVLTLAYSFVLKNVVIVDVLTVAAGFVLAHRGGLRGIPGRNFALDFVLHFYVGAVCRLMQASRGAFGIRRGARNNAARAFALYCAVARYFYRYCGGFDDHGVFALYVFGRRKQSRDRRPARAADDDHSVCGLWRFSLFAVGSFIAGRRRTRTNATR